MTSPVSTVPQSHVIIPNPELRFYFNVLVIVDWALAVLEKLKKSFNVDCVIVSVSPA